MDERAKLRAEHPEIAAVVDDIRARGGVITGMALYDAAGTLIAGKPLPTYTDEIEMSGEQAEALMRSAARYAARNNGRGQGAVND